MKQPRSKSASTGKTKVAPSRATNKAKKKSRTSWQTGTPKTRRLKNRLGKAILSHTRGMSAQEAAEVTGLASHDIVNLKAGNAPSLRTLCKLVANGRYQPDLLLLSGKFRKLRRSVSTRSVRIDLIANRLRKLAYCRPAKELAKLTGLPPDTIYQYRSAGRMPGLHLFLGFFVAGAPCSYILFGKDAPRDPSEFFDR